MSEFSDRPFVAGTITGLRAFRIDTLGRLTGVTYKDVWTPGENVAVCHADNTFANAIQMAAALSAQIDLTFNSQRGFDRKGKKAKGIPKIPTPGEKAAKLTHALAGIACQCGFYAYFDGGNDYLSQAWASGGAITISNGYLVTGGSEDRAPRVAAVVNGWGLVTVGSRGFRAEKAEVVALISPKSEQAKHEVAFAKVRRNYPDVEVFETEVEAVRAFPLTDPMPYTPDTDTDFWTRSAS